MTERRDRIATGTPKRRRLDRARRGRYLLTALLGNGIVWALTAVLIVLMPRSYVSEWSIILPSSDTDAQVNLAEIGQAMATSRSSYDAKSLDPRVNYKTILSSRTVLERASALLGIPLHAYARPRIKLIDQSSVIELSSSGGSPDQALARAQALYAAFSERLDELRADEAAQRNDGIEQVIRASRAKLDAAQRDLVEFKLASQVVSATQLEQAVARQGMLQQREQELSSELARTQRFASALARSMHVPANSVGRIVALQNDTQFLLLLQRHAQLGADLAEFRGKWDEGHPQVVSARARHEAAFRALVERARAVLAAPVTGDELRRLTMRASDGAPESLLRELLAAQARTQAYYSERAQVRKQIENMRGQLDTLARGQTQLEDLERRLQFYEAIFNAAIGKTDIGRSNVFSSYPLAQVLVAPSLPAGREKRPLLLALAGAAGCSLLLSTALTLAWLRRKAGAPA